MKQQLNSILDWLGLAAIAIDQKKPHVLAACLREVTNRTFILAQQAAELTRPVIVAQQEAA